MHTAISDLFFNMEHRDLNLLYENKPPQECVEVEDINNALKDDAESMVIWMESLGHTVTPEQLIEDWHSRV